MKLPEIIGIAGTNGAGKDTLADLRVERQDARKISLSDILRSEAANRELDSGRENLGEISTEFARRFGSDALSMIAFTDFLTTRSAQETGLSVVSIRRPAEAKVIQDIGGLVFWIDARQSERYERINKGTRNRIEDKVSFEAFAAREEVEMNPISDDPTLLNMAGVREMANIHLWNTFSETKDYRGFLIDHYEL